MERINFQFVTFCYYRYTWYILNKYVYKHFSLTQCIKKISVFILVNTIVIMFCNFSVYLLWVDNYQIINNHRLRDNLFIIILLQIYFTAADEMRVCKFENLLIVISIREAIFNKSVSDVTISPNSINPLARNTGGSQLHSYVYLIVNSRLLFSRSCLKLAVSGIL